MKHYKKAFGGTRVKVLKIQTQESSHFQFLCEPNKIGNPTAKIPILQ